MSSTPVRANGDSPGVPEAATTPSTPIAVLALAADGTPKSTPTPGAPNGTPAAADETPNRRRDKASLIWEIYAEEGEKGARKARCLRCPQHPRPFYISICGGSTSAMWKHAEFNHKAEWERLKKGESVLPLPPVCNEPNGIRRALAGLAAYTDAEHRAQLTRLVVLSDLSFSFIQSNVFTAYVQWLCPQANVPSRTTVARDIHSSYKKHKAAMKERLLQHPGKVSFTTDIWSGGNNAAFMVITCHWINPVDFAQEMAILDFIWLPGSHTGKAIHDAFVECVYDDWQLGAKVFSITTDNASSNVSFIDQLVVSKSFVKARHIRCWAHVANLAVVEILEDPAVRVVLERLRFVANHLNGSPQRLHRFRLCCERAPTTATATVAADEVPMLDENDEAAADVNPTDPTTTKARSIPLDTPTR